jgi:hypothetical protein
VTSLVSVGFAHHNTVDAHVLQAMKEQSSLNALIVPLVQDGLSPGVRLLYVPDVLYANASKGCYQPR